LFRLPGDPDDPMLQNTLAGLQSRVQMNNIIQQQLAAGGPNVQSQLQQNIRAGQDQLNDWKNLLTLKGAGNNNDLVPEGFKPNNQKTKSFFKRLEYGFNFQSQKATNFFPVTSDIGLSIGYKLSDNGVAGIGASYKLGLGRGWNNINFTSQGIGLRSFIDWRIKGSFWVSGGYEQNYKKAFSDFGQLKDLNAWQQSGLLGLTKKYKVGRKYNGKLQLLWDFLSYQQVPATTPLIIRIGFSLK
jgi:hypothetical protein